MSWYNHAMFSKYFYFARYTKCQGSIKAQKYSCQICIILSICSQFISSLRCTLPKSNGPVCRNKLVLLYLCSIMLAQSYAPEPNPGPRPVKFPCAICHKAVKWSTPGVCCDSCDVWYHQECMGMPDCIYDGLKYISWECFQCGVPNISTSIFDTTIFESSNWSLDISAHSNFGPCQFRPITKSAYTISAHRYNKV